MNWKGKEEMIMVWCELLSWH